MGMDVYGRSPDSEQGKYFRNNAWWWRPLWDYCAKVAPQVITPELHKAGHYNDGAGPERQGALALADVLEAELKSGKTRVYAADYEARQNGTPDEECSICGGTGLRQRAPNIGPGIMPCNGCDAKGHRRPPETFYYFEESNVREFVHFLRHCGGFKVC